MTWRVPPFDRAAGELVREAREWLARPLEPTAAALAQRRYAAVDLLDDARDTGDPAAVALLLGEAVDAIVAYAFWRRRMVQPRRKTRVAALAAIDPDAAALVRAWAANTGDIGVVTALANRVLDVDTFFDWTSAREPAV